jgi:hypothetical protein
MDLGAEMNLFICALRFAWHTIVESRLCPNGFRFLFYWPNFCEEEFRMGNATSSLPGNPAAPSDGHKKSKSPPSKVEYNDYHEGEDGDMDPSAFRWAPNYNEDCRDG